METLFASLSTTELFSGLTAIMTAVIGFCLIQVAFWGAKRLIRSAVSSDYRHEPPTEEELIEMQRFENHQEVVDYLQTDWK